MVVISTEINWSNKKETQYKCGYYAQCVHCDSLPGQQSRKWEEKGGEWCSCMAHSGQSKCRNLLTLHPANSAAQPEDDTSQ